MAKIGRTGFGQVEPNHLSGIVTGQINAQLPAHKKAKDAAANVAASIEILEQGQFAKYDYANNEVNFTGAGEWMLVYNEEQLYDERLQAHKDFALQANNFIGGVKTPRLIKTNIGDIFTTNTFGAATSNVAEVEGIEVSVGTVLKVDKTTGYLVLGTDANADANGPQFQVVATTTVPDGVDAAAKVMRIK